LSKKINNRRIMGAEGEWLYRCNRCDLWHPHSDFHKDKSKIFGIAYTCKDCRKNDGDIKPKLQDWEFEEGKLILERLGYNLNEDISKQFIKRVKSKYGVSLT